MGKSYNLIHIDDARKPIYLNRKSITGQVALHSITFMFDFFNITNDQEIVLLKKSAVVFSHVMA